MSVTDLCNIALTRIGATPIISLDEASPSARICRQFYAATRDALLREHPWNFAIRRVGLARDSQNPVFGFSCRHQLPGDCLRVLRLQGEAGSVSDPVYRVEARHILSDVPKLAIEYIARIEDSDLFDPLFADCLSQRLAAEISVALSDNASLSETLWRTYHDKMSLARAFDAREGTPRVLEADQWTGAR